MIPYQKEKIENAILFFANEQAKSARKPLYQTYLFKYLAFLDFECLKETGRPSLGLTYKALKKGPVPIDLYNQNITFESFEYVTDELGKFIKPKKKPDMNFFSKLELKIMNRLVEIYAQNYIMSKHISDASHEAILAWKRTWRSDPNGIIDYSLNFDGNVLKKSHDKLTYQEENYLLHCAFDDPH
ncbi:MAG: type II toxin-antitoxin system antitoxin SocA domain-containing protein [Syntrophales bacterium]